MVERRDLSLAVEKEVEDEKERLTIFREEIRQLQEEELKIADSGKGEAPSQDFIDFSYLKPEGLGEVDMEAYEALKQLKIEAQNGELNSVDKLKTWDNHFKEIYGDPDKKKIKKCIANGISDCGSDKKFSIALRGYIREKSFLILSRAEIALEKNK